MARLPSFFLDTVFAMGIGEDPAERSWIGSGFLFGKYSHTGKDPENPASKEEKKLYHIWLVTNKHVLNEHSKIFLKFHSAKELNSKDYPVVLTKGGIQLWVGHPNVNVDVAVLPINGAYLKKDGRSFFFIESDAHSCTKQGLKENGVTEGDNVFVLGFPMGMVAPERQYVICRGGVIACVRDLLDGNASEFLLDATVFPGNSGGPVFIGLSGVHVAGSKPITKVDGFAYKRTLTSGCRRKDFRCSLGSVGDAGIKALRALYNQANPDARLAPLREVFPAPPTRRSELLR